MTICSFYGVDILFRRKMDIYHFKPCANIWISGYFIWFFKHWKTGHINWSGKFFTSCQSSAASYPYWNFGPWQSSTFGSWWSAFQVIVKLLCGLFNSLVHIWPLVEYILNCVQYISFSFVHFIACSCCYISCNHIREHHSTFSLVDMQDMDAIVLTFNALEAVEAGPLILAWAVFLCLMLSLPEKGDHNPLMVCW